MTPDSILSTPSPDLPPYNEPVISSISRQPFQLQDPPPHVRHFKQPEPLSPQFVLTDPPSSVIISQLNEPAIDQSSQLVLREIEQTADRFEDIERRLQNPINQSPRLYRNPDLTAVSSIDSTMDRINRDEQEKELKRQESERFEEARIRLEKAMGIEARMIAEPDIFIEDDPQAGASIAGARIPSEESQAIFHQMHQALPDSLIDLPNDTKLNEDQLKDLNRPTLQNLARARGLFVRKISKNTGRLVDKNINELAHDLSTKGIVSKGQVIQHLKGSKPRKRRFKK